MFPVFVDIKNERNGQFQGLMNHSVTDISDIIVHSALTAKET